MSNTIGDLIAQIDSAERRLTALISADAQPSDSELAELDKQLSESFEALMSASPEDAGGHLDRIRFLTSYVAKLANHSRLIDRILDQIQADAESICGFDADQARAAKQAEP